MNKRKALPFIYVLLALVVTWLIVYGLRPNTVPVHLYYIPIIIGAWYWGGKGGLIVGILSGLLAGPLMLLGASENINQLTWSWVSRLGFYSGVGIFAGYLFEILNAQKKEIELFGTELIEALTQSLELRDEYTNGHCERVANIAVKIGKKIGLTEDELFYLRWSGLVHDVGKIGTPEHILTKPGKLTDEEYAIVKKHPELGVKILSKLHNVDYIIDGVLHHHERIDGTGYPHGKTGEELSMQAKILAVADVWDAINSDRSYRKKLDREVALKIMIDGRGTQFDPVVLDAFLQIELREANVS